MINNVSQIASPYSKTAAKVNDTSTLDATEWNNISAAVETAHQKINQILGVTSPDEDVTITCPNEVIIHPEQALKLLAGKSGSLADVTIGGAYADDVTISKSDGNVKLSDLIIIVNYFKTNYPELFA